MNSNVFLLKSTVKSFKSKRSLGFADCAFDGFYGTQYTNLLQTYCLHARHKTSFIGIQKALFRIYCADLCNLILFSFVTYSDAILSLFCL